ncbi:MAG TPA: hypothetical protein VNK07_00060, partial [Candidatus Binatia bacterium]|nr:hypothetical protein [Candidatus Binatia bacterium]
MKKKSIFRFTHRVVVVVIVLAALVLQVLADTIRLKDGSIIKGRITKFANGKFTVVVGEGNRKRELVYDVSEIESIVF